MVYDHNIISIGIKNLKVLLTQNPPEQVGLQEYPLVGALYSLENAILHGTYSGLDCSDHIKNIEGALQPYYA